MTWRRDGLRTADFKSRVCLEDTCEYGDSMMTQIQHSKEDL